MSSDVIFPPKSAGHTPALASQSVAFACRDSREPGGPAALGGMSRGTSRAAVFSGKKDRQRSPGSEFSFQHPGWLGGCLENAPGARAVPARSGPDRAGVGSRTLLTIVLCCQGDGFMCRPMAKLRPALDAISPPIRAMKSIPSSTAPLAKRALAPYAGVRPGFGPSRPTRYFPVQNPARVPGITAKTKRAPGKGSWIPSQPAAYRTAAAGRRPASPKPSTISLRIFCAFMHVDGISVRANARRLGSLVRTAEIPCYHSPDGRHRDLFWERRRDACSGARPGCVRRPSANNN